MRGVTRCIVVFGVGVKVLGYKAGHQINEQAIGADQVEVGLDGSTAFFFGTQLVLQPRTNRDDRVVFPAEESSPRSTNSTSVNSAPLLLLRPQ